LEASANAAIHGDIIVTIRNAIRSVQAKIKRIRKDTASAIALAGVLLLALSSRVHAYTVEVSTNTLLEQQFLTATEEQFQVIVTTNPFIGNTYNMNLLGTNPNYVLPGQLVPSLPCQLDQDMAAFVAQSTTTYLYGWRDGATYLDQSEIGFVGAMGNLCQNATNFALINATTTTWNKATCEDALGAVVDQLFSVQTGTPTFIPGEP